MRHHETPWYTMRHHDTPWDTMRHCETPWDTIMNQETESVDGATFTSGQSSIHPCSPCCSIWGSQPLCTSSYTVLNSNIPQTEQHKPKWQMLFHPGYVTYLLDVTPSNLLPHPYHLHPFHCMFKDLVAKQQTTNVYTVTNTCYSLSIHTSLPSVSCALQAT